MSNGEQLWVADSSSLIAVREQVSRANERQTWALLTTLVNKDRLFWPPEVTHELERGDESDPARQWVMRHRARGERAAKLEIVKSVLAVAPTLVDADATQEQADPYVLALALETRDLFQRPRIVTDDRRDKPGKLSLATAAGMLDVATVPLKAFLSLEGR